MRLIFRSYFLSTHHLQIRTILQLCMSLSGSLAYQRSDQPIRDGQPLLCHYQSKTLSESMSGSGAI